jgi:hypothetical protein
MIQGRRSLATIATTRAAGITKIRVWCEKLYCGHSEVIDIAALGLPDETYMRDIEKLRRFRCRRCNGTRVSIRLERPPAPGTPGYNGGKYPES